MPELPPLPPRNHEGAIIRVPSQSSRGGRNRRNQPRDHQGSSPPSSRENTNRSFPSNEAVAAGRGSRRKRWKSSWRGRRSIVGRIGRQLRLGPHHGHCASSGACCECRQGRLCSSRQSCKGGGEEIRSAHNSFARRDAFLSDPDKARRMATEDDDVFHFIAYVPHSNGTVYELDGLKAGPVRCGEYDVSDDANPLSWLATARSAIQARIDKYAATEIKFNLMGVVNDRRPVLEAKLEHLRAAGMDDSTEDVATVLAELAGEEEKRSKWKVENERRQHNYLPFCMELIRSLAGSGKLPDIVKKANERQVEARKQMMAQRMAAMGEQK